LLPSEYEEVASPRSRRKAKLQSDTQPEEGLRRSKSETKKKAKKRERNKKSKGKRR
jgi:hypothetical protein